MTDQTNGKIVSIQVDPQTRDLLRQIALNNGRSMTKQLAQIVRKAATEDETTQSLSAKGIVLTPAPTVTEAA